MQGKESQDIVERLSDQINDLVLHAHSSKNKEVSDLFAEIKKDVHSINEKFSGMNEKFVRLEVALGKLEESYTDKVLPNLHTWNNTANNQSRLTWLIVSTVVIALLGLVISKNAGF